jgi:hypothetical protein
MLPNHFGQIMKVEKMFCYCPPIAVLSHMKESVLARTTLEAPVNMRRYFNPLKSRGQTNLLIL